MKLLVTGGAGFIGSNFVRMALTDKFPDFNVEQLTVLDLLTYAGDEENLKPVSGDKRYKFVKGDIRDLELAKKLMQDADQVVHFAAESHVDRSIEGGSEFVSTNVMGTQVLLDAAKSINIKRSKVFHKPISRGSGKLLLFWIKNSKQQSKLLIIGKLIKMCRYNFHVISKSFLSRI